LEARVSDVEIIIDKENEIAFLLTVAAIVHFAPGPIEQLEGNDRFTFGVCSTTVVMRLLL